MTWVVSFPILRPFLTEMLRAGNEIHLLMKDTNKKLKVSQGLPDWKAYLDFVNDIIVGGFFSDSEPFRSVTRCRTQADLERAFEEAQAKRDADRRVADEALLEARRDAETKLQES